MAAWHWTGSPRVRISLALLVAAILLPTLSLASLDFGLTWDESIYFSAADAIRDWSHRGCPMDTSSLNAGWMASPIHLPHPAMSRILSALGAEFLKSVFNFPLDYRILHYGLVSLCTALSYVLVAKRVGAMPALLLPLLVFLQPRVFGHSLMGTTDGPIAHLGLAITLLAMDITSFGGNRKKWSVLLFLMILAATMKLPGLFAIPAYLIWSAFHAKQSTNLKFLAGWVISIASIAFTSPHAWKTPIEYIASVLIYPFIKGDIAPIATFYHSKLQNSPPWYYGWEWTWATCPWYLLILSALGIFSAFSKPTLLSWTRGVLPFTILWSLMAFTSLAPRHDEVRQFISLFVLIGFWSAIGTIWVLHRVSTKWLAFLITTPLLMALGLEWKSTAPHFLSYFTPQYGGIVAAERNGLDLSMYYEAINRSVLEDLNRLLPPHARVRVIPYWYFTLTLAQRAGILRNDLKFQEFALSDNWQSDFDYILAVHRVSGSSPGFFRVGQTIAEWQYNGVALVRLATMRKSAFDSVQLRINKP